MAVPHRSGMLPIMITPQVGAYLDWLFMFIKEHVLCIFDERVAQSFGRMKVRAISLASRALSGQ